MFKFKIKMQKHQVTPLMSRKLVGTCDLFLILVTVSNILGFNDILVALIVDQSQSIIIIVRGMLKTNIHLKFHVNP